MKRNNYNMLSCHSTLPFVAKYSANSCINFASLDDLLPFISKGKNDDIPLLSILHDPSIITPSFSISNVPLGVYVSREFLLLLKKLCNRTQHFCNKRSFFWF